MEEGIAQSQPGLLDDFNRANTATPSGWTQIQNGSVYIDPMRINANALSGTSNGAGSYWNNTDFPADVEVSATIALLPGSDMSLQARLQNPLSGTPNFYQARLQSTGNLVLNAWVNGGVTQLASVGVSPSVGDTIALRCQGTRISVLWKSGASTVVLINLTDSRVAGRGFLGADNVSSVGAWDNFSGTALNLGVVILARRFLGPRPPSALLPNLPPIVAPVASVRPALMRRAQAQRRTSKYLLFPSATLAKPPPVVTNLNVFTVTMRADQRRRFVYLLQPPAVVEPSLQPPDRRVEIEAVLTRTRPRPTEHLLPTGVVEPSLQPPDRRLAIQVNDLAMAEREARPRHTWSFLSPPVASTSAFVVAPATVTLVRLRPRPTRHFLSSGVVESSLQPPDRRLEVSVALTRIRPRPARRLLTAISYPQATTVKVAAVAVRIPLEDKQRRRARSFLNAGVSEPYLSPPDRRLEVVAALVHSRPRKTLARLTSVTYPATSTIVLKTIRTRPRPIRFFVLPQVIEPYVRPPDHRLEVLTILARTRPRPTVHRLTAVTYPQATLIAQAEVAVRTPVDDKARRRTRSFIGSPVVEPSLRPPDRRLEILAALVQTRPRKTRLVLTAVTYPATSTVFTKEVTTRPRKTRAFLVAPVVEPSLRPPDRRLEVAAALVRTRPWRTTAFFTRFVTYPQTSVIPVRLARIRPARTHSLVAPPSSLVVAQPPVVTTLAIHTTRTRPRATRAFIVPPRAEPYLRAPDRRLEVASSLVRVRPRPTRRSLTAVVYRATSTIRVQTVRARPRPTTHTGLTYVAYPQVTPVAEAEVSIKTVLDDRRRRQTHSVLSPPRFYAQTSTIRVLLTATRPRPTRHFLTAVRYPQTSVIRATRVIIRPRRTRYWLTSVTYPQTGAVAVAVVHTRPRRTRTFLPVVVPAAPPVVTQIRTRTTKTRPHPTTARFINPVTYPSTSQISTHLVQTRPRATRVLFTRALFFPATSVIATHSVAVFDGARRAAQFHTAPILTAHPPRLSAGTLTVTLALQTRLGLIRRRPHNLLAPPAVVHIPLSPRTPGFPTSGWLAGRPQLELETTEPEGDWTIGIPEQTVETDTLGEGWEAGKPT